MATFSKHSSGRPRAECRVSVSFPAMSTAKPMESTRSARWSGFPVTRTEIAALLFGKTALCEISTTSNRPATPRGSNRPETSTKPARLPGGRSTRPVSDEHFSPRRTDLLGESPRKAGTQPRKFFGVEVGNRQSTFGNSESGGIAQLVERQLCKLEVRGSNPLASKAPQGVEAKSNTSGSVIPLASN